MGFSETLQRIGRFVGLYSDAEEGEYQYDEYGQPIAQQGRQRAAPRGEPVYDEYGQPEMDYEPEQAYDDQTYQTNYGSGSSYMRAGARPVRNQAQAAPPRRPAPEQAGRARQPQQQPQPQPRQARYDNVIPLPEREARGAEPSPAQPAQASTIIFCVRRKDDSSLIIDYLLHGVNVILNFEEVDDVQCQRVLDMVSGAAYALRASVERISHRNYLVAPTGVKIVRGETQGREAREAQERGARESYERSARDVREDYWDGFEDQQYAAQYS